MQCYSTDFGDLVPLIIATSFQLCIVICGQINQRNADCNVIQIFILPATDCNCLLYIILFLANSHYSSTKFQHISSPALYSSSGNNFTSQLLFTNWQLLSNGCKEWVQSHLATHCRLLLCWCYIQFLRV